MDIKRRLFVDIDGTLARFHDADKLFIEAMWTPGFYTGLKPFENAVEGVKRFVKQHPEVDVYILSAVLDTDPPFIVGEKNEWLDKYLPEVPAERRIFTHAGDNKADYIGGIGENDYLLDDFNKNLFEFQDAGAHAIKFHNDVNMRGLGAYGGEAGPLWSGDIVHYDAIPETFAASLAHLVCGEPMPFLQREDTSRSADKDSLLEKMAAAEHIKQSENNRDIKTNGFMDR